VPELDQPELRRVRGMQRQTGTPLETAYRIDL
jgi:hypothetical protein